jgi:hypothetical protein
MVAEMLGKREHEVSQEMTMEELNTWVAFSHVKDERMKKSSKK